MSRLWFLRLPVRRLDYVCIESKQFSLGAGLPHVCGMGTGFLFKRILVRSGVFGVRTSLYHVDCFECDMNEC